MSSTQFNFQANLDEIAQLVESESSLTKEKATIAEQMHGIVEKINEGSGDNDKLGSEYDRVKMEWEAKDRQSDLVKIRRKTLEELSAQHAVLKHAVDGDDRPMMLVSDAMGSLVRANIGDPVPEDEVKAAKATLERRNVGFDNDSTSVRFNLETMIATRDGNNSTISLDNAIPTETVADFVDRVQAYGGATEAIRIQETMNGVAIEYPVIDFTAKIATSRTEGTQTPSGDIPTPTKVVFKPHLIQTGVHELTIQSIRDAAPDVIASAYRQLDRMKGVLVNNELTYGTGDGNADTQGIVTGAGEGHRLTTDALTYESFVELIFSVDAAYRKETYGSGLKLGRIRDGKVCFMFHDSTLKELWMLKDGENRPLWLPDIRGGTAHTILGHPYVINQSMDIWGQDANTGSDRDVICFGNFDYYMARFVPNGSYTDLYVGDTYRSKQAVGVASFGEFCGAYCGGFSTGNESEAVKKLVIQKAP